jgi:hypothetical protein
MVHTHFRLTFIEVAASVSIGKKGKKIKKDKRDDEWKNDEL